MRARAQAPQACANCQTQHTPLWRKDKSTGLVMCNACGIYFKNHGRHRTLELIESNGSGAFGGSAKAAAGLQQQHSFADEPAAPALPGVSAEVRRLALSHSTPSCLARCALLASTAQHIAHCPYSPCHVCRCKMHAPGTHGEGGSAFALRSGCVCGAAAATSAHKCL
jgi:hypothetical protein